MEGKPSSPRVAEDHELVIELVDVQLIDGNQDQPRRTMLTAALDELTESVRQHGLLQPIRVRPKSGRYEVVAGHRRLAASRRAGLERIPAVVVQADDGRVLIESLVENIQREDLNPLERGEALRRLRLNLAAQSWEEVGRLIGISRRHVYHLLNVSDLPEAIREDVQVGLISEKHCRALIRLRKHPELQASLWRRITAERVSGDDSLYMAREMLAEHEGRLSSVSSPCAGRLGPIVQELQWLLPRATMGDVRPLRGELESVTRRLIELLVDAFYSERADGTQDGSLPRALMQVLSNG